MLREKVMKRIFVLGFVIVMLAGCGNDEVNSDNDVVQKVEATDEEKKTEESEKKTIPKWRKNMAQELIEDIDKAFKEIGENSEYILDVKYVTVRKTDLFDRRDYKVTFDNKDEKGFVHAKEYRITTEEWHEGEPEREKYPREYLVTIKFWKEDNSTNINQWMHTGGGKLQED